MQNPKNSIQYDSRIASWSASTVGTPPESEQGPENLPLRLFKSMPSIYAHSRNSQAENGSNVFMR